MNETVGEKKITLCGKEFVLRPNFQAIAEIESMAKTSIVEMLDRASKFKMNVMDVVAIVYWDGKSEAFYMLFVYAKGEREDLTRGQIKVLRKIVREEFG